MKTIIVQKAFRSLQSSDVLSKLKFLKKQKNYKCDYLFMFNNETGKIYKSFLKGKIIPIGSFKSNSVVRRKKIKKSIELLYISVFRPHPYKTKNEDYVFCSKI